MGFTADFTAGVAALLAAAQVGKWDPTGAAYGATDTGIFDSVVPPSPSRVVVLTVYNADDDPTQADSDPWLQVRTRSTGRDPRDSTDLQDAVFDVLQNLPATTLAGHRVTGCWRRSGPAYLGADDNGRHEHTANYQFRAHRPSPNRF